MATVHDARVLFPVIGPYRPLLPSSVSGVELADANWMLSSAVQSGAALVAIVGGLLGSRYVALDAEQGAARRRLRETNDQLEEARRLQSAAHRALTESVVADLLENEDCYVRILHLKGHATLEQIVGDRQVSEEHRAALEERLEILLNEFERARKTLDELVPRSASQSSWDVFKTGHDLNPREEALWKWMYELTSERRSAEARAKANQAGKWLGGAFGNIPTSIPLMSPVISPLMHLGAVRGGGLRAAQEAADHEVSRLEGQAAAAEAHLESTRQPQGFGLAIQVLAYIALVDIVFPLALMTIGKTSLQLGMRIAVAVLFVSGVVVLLRYLFVYGRQLGDRSGRYSLPKSVVGLVWRRD